MRLFEFIFCAIGLALLAAMLIRPLRPYLKPRPLLLAGLVVLIPGLVFEGYRWQMLPAYLAVGFLAAAQLKRSDTAGVWRVLGAAPVLLLLLLAFFLTNQMPVPVLPEPSGAYAVGTFDYTVTDTSRTERYQPERNRTLPVSVWYPVEKSEALEFPVKPFWQEMYRGSLDPASFLFGYLRHIDTHSHSEAPIAQDGTFPVLIYNPGGWLWPVEQNTLLIEHLVSHGYVVFGIGHPFANRTTLPGSGTIRTALELPADVTLDSSEPPGIFTILGGTMELWGPLWQTRDRELFEAFNSSLSRFMAVGSTLDREAVIAEVLESGALASLDATVSADTLMEVYLAFMHLTLQNHTWVEDTQFVADNISRVAAPVDGFLDQLELDGLGLFGMSLGGSVAASFCKIDSRCIAGVNLDGTEFHVNWNTPVASPFLKLHHEGSPDNNFSLLPPADDFHSYTVAGTEHMDFMDSPYFLPITQTLGMRGTINGARIIEIVNSMVLNYFDHYLKAPDADLNLDTYPEVVVRGLSRELNPASADEDT